MHPTHEENEALVRRFLTDVIQGGDTDASDAFVADDVVDHKLVFGDEPPTGGVTALGWQVLAAADVQITIEDGGGSVTLDIHCSIHDLLLDVNEGELITRRIQSEDPPYAHHAGFFKIDGGLTVTR